VRPFTRSVAEDEPQHLRGVKARFGILGFLLVMAVVVSPMEKVGFYYLPSVMVLITLALFSNFLSFLWIVWGKGIRYRIYFAALVDVCLVTAAVHYVGGIESPASWIYAVVAIAYASLYGMRAGISTAAISSVLYSSLLYAEYAGLIEHIPRSYLNPVYIHESPSYLAIKLLCDNFLFFTSAIVSGLLSERLIKHKRELEDINEELRKEITERQRAEKARRDSGAKYQALVEQSLQGLVVIQDFRIVFANPALGDILGYSVEELLSLSSEKVQELVHPDDRKAVWERFKERLESKGEPARYEFKAIKKDGTASWLEMLASRIEYRGGPAVQAIFLDITERKRAEQALRESEERYRLHFEHVNDCIYSYDSNYCVTSVSPSVERLLGYRPEELIGRNFGELNVLAPEYFEKALEEAGRVFAGERIISSEYEFITKEGKRRLGSVSGAPLMRDGKVIAVVSVARDITDRKQLERQLMQAQKMESIGTLAGGIAHDFNNLLGGILGYASFMKTKLSKEHEFFNYVNTIERSASRAAELTGQLLAFARGGKYEAKIINLTTVIHDVLEIIGRTFDKSIVIEAHLCESLPTVEADAAQMQQVLMNLCVNARDAMPNGGKLIIETGAVVLTEEYLNTHADARPGAYVILSVTDTGIGMDSATMQRVFEPFFTTKEEGKGTGLGLSMVYGVVKNHGGYINVYSEVGEGSTFKIYLPVSGKMEAKDPAGCEPPLKGNELILVVDDEDSIRALAKDILENYGYRVIVAENGEEAVRIYQELLDQIDLTILDMIMPRMNGRETFLNLKKLNPAVRTLLSTGYSQNGKAKEILDSGVMGFLQKPYHAEALLSKVRTVLDS
jgi:PAS domain S-box-containing protein